MYKSRPRTGYNSKNRPNIGQNNNNFNPNQTEFRKTFFIQKKEKGVPYFRQQELAHVEK